MLLKNMFQKNMSKLCSSNNVIQKLISLIRPVPFLGWIKWQQHKELLVNEILSSSVKLLIFNWCKCINKKLKDKDSRNKYSDPMHVKATEKYKKKLKI